MVELNKKILKVGLISIALSVAITIGLFLRSKLENPVFLKMYFEQHISYNDDTDLVENFSLAYITNIEDGRKIKEIHFEEEPDIEVTVSYTPMGYGFSFFNNYNHHEKGESYGRYVLHTIYLGIDLNSINEESYEVELNNAKVTFDDNSTFDTNLGRIIIYKDASKKGDVHFTSRSSSSNGTSESSIMSEKNLKLLKVSSPLLEDLEDYFDLSIKDTDYREVSGIKYKSGQILQTNAKFHSPEHIIDQHTFYDIRPKLYYEDEEGNESYVRILNIDYYPYNFSGIELFNYLRARGAI